MVLWCMRKNMEQLVSDFRGKKVVVWGDFILDEYIYTTTGRISREAPVLVTEFESNEYILGGAGNVIMNIEALGAIPIPVGLIGTNADGDTLKNILEKSRITTGHLVQLEGYRTPKKSRILSGGEHTKKQQVLRIDCLNRAEVDDSAYRQMEEQLGRLLDDPQCSTLIISDYIYKSVQPELFQRLREQYPQKRFIIDSRQHLSYFRDVTIATPNEPEIKKLFPARQFYDEQEFFEAGNELLKRLNSEGLLLKLGHAGMIVFRRDQEPVKLAIHGSTDIVDVTGAGDTVISVVGLAMSAGADLPAAAQLANIAAGMVVMKEGAYAISYSELLNELKQIS